MVRIILRHTSNRVSGLARPSNAAAYQRLPVKELRLPADAPLACGLGELVLDALRAAAVEAAPRRAQRRVDVLDGGGARDAARSGLEGDDRAREAARELRPPLVDEDVAARRGDRLQLVGAQLGLARVIDRGPLFLKKESHEAQLPRAA